MIGVPPAETARTNLAGVVWARLLVCTGNRVVRWPPTQTKIRESSVVIGATAILVLAGLWCSMTYDLPDCAHHMRQSADICTVFIAVLAVVWRHEQGELK